MQGRKGKKKKELTEEQKEEKAKQEELVKKKLTGYREQTEKLFAYLIEQQKPIKKQQDVLQKELIILKERIKKWERKLADEENSGLNSILSNLKKLETDLGPDDFNLVIYGRMDELNKIKTQWEKSKNSEEKNKLEKDLLEVLDFVVKKLRDPDLSIHLSKAKKTCEKIWKIRDMEIQIDKRLQSIDKDLSSMTRRVSTKLIDIIDNKLAKLFSSLLRYDRATLAKKARGIIKTPAVILGIQEIKKQYHQAIDDFYKVKQEIINDADKNSNTAPEEQETIKNTIKETIDQLDKFGAEPLSEKELQILKEKLERQESSPFRKKQPKITPYYTEAKTPEEEKRFSLIDKFREDQPLGSGRIPTSRQMAVDNKPPQLEKTQSGDEIKLLPSSPRLADEKTLSSPRLEGEKDENNISSKSEKISSPPTSPSRDLNTVSGTKYENQHAYEKQHLITSTQGTIFSKPHHKEETKLSPSPRTSEQQPKEQQPKPEGKTGRLLK